MKFPGLKVILGLDKMENLVAIIRFNGGIRNSIYKLFVHDDLKIGKLVGEDKYGNKYYENPYYFVPRNRWVEYNEKVFLDYDSSQIPAEWHGWLHHTTENPPTVEKPVEYPWIAPHKENQTGTTNAFIPWDTTPKKIESWTPKGGGRSSDFIDSKK
ncbi:putative NADH dehydrogenase [ubiquinone] 1 alpha subcomplex subunit 12, partial [Fragariocoptes setiger]